MGIQSGLGECGGSGSTWQCIADAQLLLLSSPTSLVCVVCLVSLEVDLPLENHFLSSSCGGPSVAIVVGGGHSSGGQMVRRMAQSSCHCSHLFDNFLSSSSSSSTTILFFFFFAS